MAEAPPSKFWAGLNAEHERQLAELGPEVCKRAQALRYFTWRWRPAALRGSEQLRFLVRNSGPGAWLRALSPRSVSVAARHWEPVDWPLRERLAYTAATRLIWSYAERAGCREVLELGEPEAGRPFPVRIGKRLISQDLANSALEVAAIKRALGPVRPRSILEIGAGYGRLGYALMGVFPEARYTVVDIEPARTLSRWYLSQLFEPSRLTFLAPEQVAAGALGEREFDLAVSVSSLQEMTSEQVRGYIELLDRSVHGTVFLKQWRDWLNPDDGVRLRFADYPVPPSWRPLFSEPAPIQTDFVQAAWTVSRGSGESRRESSS